MIDRRGGVAVRAGILAVVFGGFACGKDPVQENRPPVAVGSIPDTTLVEGDVYTRNVAEFFNDPDDDDLNYSALSANSAVATASVSGETMTVRAVAEGTARVTVTAVDGGGLSATQSFDVTVERPNQPPVVATAIPDLTLTEDDTIRVDVSLTFSDPDGDPLAYAASSDAPGTATATVDGSEVIVVGVAPGAAEIVVTASDPEGLSVADTFAATVERRNRAPVTVGSIPDTTLVEGEEFTATVSQFFSDPDGDELTYTAESSDTGVVTPSMSNDTITVTAAGAGTATITVTATDPEGLSASQTAEFTVEKPNRAPVIADTIPDQTVTEDDTLVLNVSNYFSDPDGDSLTYTAESDDTTVAAVAVDGSDVAIMGLEVGSSTVSVTATDPEGLSVTQAFDASVRRPNNPPRPVGKMPDVDLHVNDPFTGTVSQYFTDPDGDELAYTAVLEDTTVATASVSGDTLTVTAVTQGITSITVTATDPGGLSAIQPARVTVINRAPVAVGEIPPDTLVEKEQFKGDVSPYFSDPDADDLTYKAESSDDAVALAWASGDSIVVTAVKEGTATITVTATDPGGLSATQTTEFTVREPNNAPKAVGEIPAQSIERDDTVKLDVSEYFEDPDGDTLTYTASSSDETVADTDADGDTVTIVGAGKGRATVTVTATDPEGLTATQEIPVGVNAPRAVGEIPDRAMTEGDTVKIDVSEYFEDPDDDELTYTVESSRRSVARPSVSGSTATIVARAPGRATLTVTATDPDDLKATQEFRAGIARPLPVHDLFIEVDTAGDVDTLSSVTLDMAGYFGDTDSVFDYEAEIGRDDVAEIESVDETEVTVEPLEVDTAVITDKVLFDTTTVSVTATDDHGLAVTQEAMVRVAPGDYEAWELIEITDEGKIKAAALLELGDCFDLDEWVWGDTVYTVHWSEWQVQRGTGWVQVPGTYVELQVCPYDDIEDEPGTYRFVGEASVWLDEDDPEDTVRTLRRADNTVEIEDSRPPPPPDFAAAYTAPGPAGAHPARPHSAALIRPRSSARLRSVRRSRRGRDGAARCAYTHYTT